MGLHMAVVAVVASAALVGGRLTGFPSGSAPRAALAPASRAALTPTPQAAALTSPSVAGVATSSKSSPAAVAKEQSQDQSARQALAMSVEPLAEKSGMAEEGVVAVRSSVSSRGGSAADLLRRLPRPARRGPGSARSGQPGAIGPGSLCEGSRTVEGRGLGRLRRRAEEDGGGSQDAGQPGKVASLPGAPPEQRPRPKASGVVASPPFPPATIVAKWLRRASWLMYNPPKP